MCPCPPLVTGSRHDRRVRFSYAEDPANIIPAAVLVELLTDSYLLDRSQKSAWPGYPVLDRSRKSACLDVQSLID
jgi:hypothetical protein